MNTKSSGVKAKEKNMMMERADQGSGKIKTGTRQKPLC